MTASDPFLAEIVTRFEAFDVQAGRGGLHAAPSAQPHPPGCVRSPT